MCHVSRDQYTNVIQKIYYLDFNVRCGFFSIFIFQGNGGVGKSCLMNRFMSNQFDENSFHTIGVEFLNKDIEIDGEKYTLQ